MSYARELIDAIQSCSTQRLRQAIAQVQSDADKAVSHLPAVDQAWARQTRNPVNDALPGLGLTALHVAAKAYSAHAHDRALAGVFNQMVRMLLSAGASPFVEVGAVYQEKWVRTQGADGQIEERRAVAIKQHGLTVAQVCQGRVPPALTAWFADLPPERDTLMATHDKSPRAAEVQRRRQMAQARRERLKQAAVA